MKNWKFVFAAAALLAAGTVRAEDGKVGALYRMNSETEAKIQAHVLDTLLGPGKAFAFLEMQVELRSLGESQSKSGTGEMSAEIGDAPLPGKDAVDPGSKEKKQKQRSSQTKKSAEKKDSFGLEPRAMKLRLLHDASVPAGRLKAVVEALAALYPGSLKPEDITLVPAAFAPAAGRAEASAE